ncbi:MAG: hypothetical protein QXQ87_09705 [Halobacteria archaeon]
MALLEAPLWLQYSVGVVLFLFPLVYTLLCIEKLDPASGTWRPLIPVRKRPRTTPG